MTPKIRKRSRLAELRSSADVEAIEATIPNWPLEGPDLQVERVPPGNLKPPKRKLRKHSPKQVEQLVACLRRFGIMTPIVVDKDLNVIVGELRRQAALAMGLGHVPVLRVEHLTEAELRAYALADNKLVENGSWDEELLAFELSELMILDPDLEIEITGFETTEIDNLILGASSSVAGATEEEVPEPDEGTCVSTVGDLFKLGDHRLLCGDAREEQSYQIVFGKELARMVFCDNPYNIKIKGNVSGLGKVKHSEFVMGSGELSEAEFTAFLAMVWKHCARFSMDGSIHYQCMDHRHIREVMDAGETAYDELKTLICWDKQVSGMGSFYRNQHELVFVWKSGTAPHVNNFRLGETGRHRTNVWSYPGANMMRKGRFEDLALHPTVKNLTMVADAVRDVSKRGEIVLDPFCGSGTTILAAHRTGRRAHCIELDPKYVDVAIRRWQQATGEDAVHVDSGLTFGELAVQRACAALDGEDEHGDA